MSLCELGRKVVPEWAHPVCGRMYCNLRKIRVYLETLKVRRVFNSAPGAPLWLGPDTFEALQLTYPSRTVWAYDPGTREQVGRERSGQLLRLVHEKDKKIVDFLELGCFDGMVCGSLQQIGRHAVGIDIKTDAFDGRAARNGVRLLQMDAAKLDFNDNSFDFVFSYNSFEHFPFPAVVMEEAVRVLRPGGYIYLQFSPLYMSPWGLHLNKKITIPYCQFLFPENMVRDFAEKHGLGTIDYGGNNCWPLEEYRNLWRRYADKLETILYIEGYNISCMDLIAEYPSCFRSKTQFFDNLIVERIIAQFKKIR